MTGLISMRDFALRLHDGESEAQIIGPADKRTAKIVGSFGIMKSFDDATRSVDWIISTNSVDRMDDRIDQNGWDLSKFLRSPVVLWSHDSSTPAIAKASNTRLEDGALKSTATFATRDQNPLAETVYQLVTGGFINSASVGFIPKTWVASNDESRDWGIDFATQELIEWSVCNIPANADCIIDAKSKGVDVSPLYSWAEKILDGGDKIIIPRKQLEALRRQAKEPKMSKPRPRLRADEPMSETDPANGGATVGNCGRPADKECGMTEPSECSIHGFGGTGAGEPEDNADKDFRAAVRMAVRSEMRRLRHSGKKRLRRKDAADGDGDKPDDLPEGHEEGIRKAAMHFKSAEDYYDAGDEHHDEAMNLMDEASKDLDGDDPPPDDHTETVRAANARFKSADALYDLGDEHHDKAMKSLGKCIKALDADAPDPSSGDEEKPEEKPEEDPTEDDPENEKVLSAALARVKALRAA